MGRHWLTYTTQFPPTGISTNVSFIFSFYPADTPKAIQLFHALLTTVGCNVLVSDNSDSPKKFLFDLTRRLDKQEAKLSLG